MTLEAVLRYLRRLDELPRPDRPAVRRRPRPAAPRHAAARALIVSDLDRKCAGVMVAAAVKLLSEDSAETAASAFERYDLVSAPVVDAKAKLGRRLTVDAVVDYIRERRRGGARARRPARGGGRVRARSGQLPEPLGLAGDEPGDRVHRLARDRRVRGSIAKLVALAALMPIVAGIGGNSGNQTTTMLVRALALGQIQGPYWTKLLVKELGGAAERPGWGTLLGAIAYLFYRSIALGAVMALAMILNLMLSRRHGRGDPVAAGAPRQRPGAGLLGAHHRGHRLGRLLHFSRPSHALPRLRAWSKSATRCSNTSPKWLAASAGGSVSQASDSPASVTIAMPCFRAEPHHGGVLGEAVHEKRAHAPVACPQVGARATRRRYRARASTPAPRRRAPRSRRLADVGRADEVQVLAGHAEEGVALEVDALDVGADRGIAERHAEAQAPVVRAEGEKMGLERGRSTRDNSRISACMFLFHYCERSSRGGERLFDLGAAVRGGDESRPRRPMARDTRRV